MTFCTSNRPLIPVALSLGSNIGDRHQNLMAAVDLLRPLMDSIRVSQPFASLPVDCPPGAFDFINIAVIGNASLGPWDLLRACVDVESRLGRPTVRGYHENRVIDIDMLLYGDEVIADSQLTIPHPRMAQREFVLAPLAEIAADWRIPPTMERVGTMLERLREGQNPQSTIKRRAAKK